MNNVFYVTGAAVLVLAGLKILFRLFHILKGFPLLDLKGRWIVVTGCDTGIGASLVPRLAGNGARVIAFTFTAEGAEKALSSGAEIAPCIDLTDFSGAVPVCRDLLKTTGGNIWGIVHNAGAVLPGFIEFQLLENYRKMMEINFFSIVNLQQLLMPGLKNSGGRIVIMSSVDGIVSLPGNAPYDAAKFAAEAYADALRIEMSLWNIHVALVNPSTMKTPLSEKFFDSMKKSWDAMAEADPGGQWKDDWPREWLEEYTGFNAKQLSAVAQDPGCTVDNVFHALAARYPKMRYLSGRLAKSLFFLLWKMPESWSFRLKTFLVNPKPGKFYKD